MTNCKIGQIRMKNGGASIRILDPRPINKSDIEFEWGKVTIEYFSAEDLSRDTQVYFLEAAKQKIMFRD